VLLANLKQNKYYTCYKLACDDPAEYNRPISHWTARELAEELVEQAIVETISPRHVGRLLAEADLKLHQSGYWLNPPPDANFEAKVSDICETYLSATERASQGERTLCLDEMTGIQALERKAPTAIPNSRLRTFKNIDSSFVSNYGQT